MPGFPLFLSGRRGLTFWLVALLALEEQNLKYHAQQAEDVEVYDIPRNRPIEYPGPSRAGHDDKKQFFNNPA